MSESECVVLDDDANGRIGPQNLGKPVVVNLKIRRGQVDIRGGFESLSSIAERAVWVQDRKRPFVLTLT